MRRGKALSANNDSKIPAKRRRVTYHLELPKRHNVIGKVLVCGSGETGQLGLGEDIMERKRLTILENIPSPVDICAGGMHCLVLTDSGDIYSFGCNDEGALGRDTSEDGSEMLPGLVTLPGKAIRISAGDSHSACLLENGHVYAWGSFRDSHGSMGLNINGNQRDPINLLDGTICTSIASGSDHLVMLTANGIVYTVGCAEQGQLGRVAERSLGGDGRRGKSYLLCPDKIIIKRAKPFDAIWATNYCTFLRESQTGTIWGVGLNNYHQLSYKKAVDRILLPIKTDLKDIKQIAGGIHHTLVLDNTSNCFVVGRSEYGRLGLGDIKEVVSKLTQIKGFENKPITYVGCGEACSFAVTKDGSLYSWGMGYSNQLGIGDGDVDYLEPMKVVSKNTQNRRMLYATGGGQHSIFLVESEEQEEKKENVPAKKKSSKIDPIPSSQNKLKMNGNDAETEKTVVAKRGSKETNN